MQQQIENKVKKNIFLIVQLSILLFYQNRTKQNRIFPIFQIEIFAANEFLTMDDNRKESFQLLQLSDDSKSLSDLELPEITPQRKRKIRRKTRSTGNHSGRHIDGNGHHHHLDDQTPAVCQNLGLWIAIFMSCGWLLILSYMTTVVYTENRRLETQISKLSVNNLNIPEVLQKWHETSKFLEGNQTTVNEKITEIQKRMDGFEQQLIEVRSSIVKQNDLIANQMKNDDHETKNAVASFGSQIKGLTNDVIRLKESIQQMQSDIQNNRNNITQLSNRMIVTFANTSLPFGDQVNNATTRLVTNVTDYFNGQISNITTQLFTVNNTLSQRVKGLDDDVRLNQKTLNVLSDNVTSLTAKVMSLQNSLPLLSVEPKVTNTDNNDNGTTNQNRPRRKRD